MTWILDAPIQVSTLPFPAVFLAVEDGCAAVFGPSRARQDRTLCGRGHVVAGRFKPGGARDLSAVPIIDLVDAERSPTEVFGLYDLGHVENVLALEDALRAVARPRDPRANLVDRAVELIEGDSGLHRVNALGARLGVNARYLQRAFIEFIGLSPKFVMRRYRLQEAAERARDDVVDWVDLANRLGYADQAHMIREFRSVFGETPAAFRRGK